VDPDFGPGGVKSAEIERKTKPRDN
jgi:hypothetical protein